MTIAKTARRIAVLVRRIYSLKYIAANLAIMALYYSLMTWLLRLQEQGIGFSGVPVVYIYALSASASVLMTIAIYSAFNSRNNAAKYSGSASSAGAAVAGGVIAGCGCQGAILYGALIAVFGSGYATLINNIVADNALVVFGALIALNAALAAYYLGRISDSVCKLGRGRKRWRQ